MKLEGNSFSWSEIPEGVKIGKYTAIALDVNFMIDQNHPSIINKKFVSNYNFNEMFGVKTYPPCQGKGPIEIGNDVWIGRKAIIMDNVTIGDGAIIGSGSIVTKNVPPYAVAVGNPAKIKRYRFNKEIIEKLLKIKWWEWDKEMIIKRIKDFKDIEIFISKYA